MGISVVEESTEIKNLHFKILGEKECSFVPLPSCIPLSIYSLLSRVSTSSRPSMLVGAISYVVMRLCVLFVYLALNPLDLEQIPEAYSYLNIDFSLKYSPQLCMYSMNVR